MIATEGASGPGEGVRNCDVPVTVQTEQRFGGGMGSSKIERADYNKSPGRLKTTFGQW